MASKRVVEIALEGKADSAKKAFKETGDSAEGLGSKLGSLGKSFGSMATIAGGVFAGGILAKAPGIVGGLSSSFKDLELQAKKTSVVFGEDLTGDLTDWANEVARSMGLTTAQAKNAATGLADLLIPMGMSRDAAFDMSTKTIGLAGALAEWSGGQKNAIEVSEILQSAYLGETDGLKALGIAISASDVEARLAAKGQEDLTGKALEQAQALAIQELVFEKSTDAQKAFAEGSGSAARKSAEMTARMNEAKDKLSMALGPAIVGVTTLLANAAVPAFDLLGKGIAAASPFVQQLTDKVKSFFQGGEMDGISKQAGGVVAALGTFVSVALPKLQEFWAWIQPQLVNLGKWVGEEFAKFQEYWKSDIEPALSNIRAGVEAVIAFIRDHWPEIEKIIRPIMDIVRVHIETVVKVIMGVLGILIDLIGGDFSGAWTKLKQLVKDVWDGIKQTIEHGIELIQGLAPLLLAAGKALGGALMDGIKNALGAGAGFAGDVAEAVLRAVKNIVNTQVIDRINRVLEFDFDTHIPGVGKISIDPADIKPLAKGGIVTRPTLALIGERGPEAVVPLSNGMKGMTANTITIPNITGGATIGANRIVIGGVDTGGEGIIGDAVGPPPDPSNTGDLFLDGKPVYGGPNKIIIPGLSGGVVNQTPKKVDPAPAPAAAPVTINNTINIDVRSNLESESGLRVFARRIAVMVMDEIEKAQKKQFKTTAPGVSG